MSAPLKYSDLHKYQLTMLDHVLEHPRSALFVPMGMGKTSVVLTALDQLFVSGYETQPVLVVAPLRVAQSVWPDEAAKWDHLHEIIVSPIVGTEKQRIQALKTDASVYTINYENLPWLMDHVNGHFPFGTVIADESTKLKGFRMRQGTQRAHAIARIAHTKVHRWVNLTGTPSPNGLKDLWGQTWMLDAGERLGRTYEAFKSRWFQRSFEHYSIDPLPFAQVQIEDKLRDICLAIDPKDHFDLREPIVNNIYVELPAKARVLYRQMEREMFMQIEQHEVEAFNAASRTIKCLQIANGAVYINEDASEWKELHDAKLQALEDVIEEAAGASVLVAYHFHSDLVRLCKAFPQGRVLDDNPQTIRDWNAGKIPLLFTHPASAGHGINLQDGGNIVAFFGHWWNLEEYQQIIERIGPVRQMQSGHDRPVFIHHIIARGTVDELVMARRESKREVQDILLEAMKARR